MNVDYWERKADSAKDAILDSADSCASSGTPIQMAEIANKAGISVGTIYRYFKDKEELEHALVSRMLVAMTCDIESNVQTCEPPEARLHSMLRAVCETALKHPGALYLFLRRYTYSQLRTDHAAVGETMEAYQRYVELERGIIRDLKIDSIPEVIAVSYLRASLLSALVHLQDASREEHEKSIDAAIGLTIHGLLGARP